jgi:SAM-dependent methyltransferase
MGSFWNAARREGWDAYGCDIGTALIAAAREFWKTDRLFAATAAELVQRHPGYFDVVNSSQVFEHLCDPKRTAQELHTILKPGGVLALDVPNLGTWGERVRKGFVLDVPAHFTYFSPQSIRQLLESSGYQVLGVWSGSAAMRLVSRVVRDPNVAGRLAAGLRKVGRGSGAIQVVAKAGQPLAP